jgi:hypothetical protein
MAAISIHGEKFTGNPREWKDANTEIVTAIANAGCTFVMDAGTTLFQLAGSGDHSDVGDDEIAKHFEEKEWPTQLVSIRSQITKTTLDTKCARRKPSSGTGRSWSGSGKRTRVSSKPSVTTSSPRRQKREGPRRAAPAAFMTIDDGLCSGAATNSIFRICSDPVRLF